MELGRVQQVAVVVGVAGFGVVITLLVDANGLRRGLSVMSGHGVARVDLLPLVAVWAGGAPPHRVHGAQRRPAVGTPNPLARALPGNGGGITCNEHFFLYLTQ